MTAEAYPRQSTAILVIDSYNDFLADGGKVWPYLKDSAERIGLVPNMIRLVAGARAQGLKIVFVPHHRHDPGDYEGWRFVNPTHRQMLRLQPFARGTWGGEFHPDLSPHAGDTVCSEHWMQSGFANTDLDYLLRRDGIDHLVLCGVRTNGCFESTGRYGVELGYHVTLVADATAAFRQEDMDATLLVNAPMFAHAILRTEEFLASARG